MNQQVTLTVQALGILLLIASCSGIMGGMYLMGLYVRSRGFKTKAQKELMRLNKFIRMHHPEAVREGPLVDIAIDLIKDPELKEQWRI